MTLSDMESKSALKILEELRAMAQLGLNYSNNDHDRRRYERLLEIAVTHYAAICALNPEDIRKRFACDIGHVTPKTGVNGALFSADGKLFLTRRADDKAWELPGGWAEMGESPRDSLIREFNEEVALSIEAGSLIEVFHRLPGDFNQLYTSYHLLFFCSSNSQHITLSDEVIDHGFFDQSCQLEWHCDHRSMFDAAFEYYRRTFSSTAH